MANIDEKLIAITPAMREGSGLVKFRKNFLRDIMMLLLLNNMQLHLLLELQQKIKNQLSQFTQLFYKGLMTN